MGEWERERGPGRGGRGEGVESEGLGGSGGSRDGECAGRGGVVEEER